MTIQNDKVVLIDYTLNNDNGDILDSSVGREPLAYIQGHQNIIPGLEKEMLGKKVGDKFKAVIQPEEGYGKFNPALLQDVPRSAFQGVDEIAVGMQFQAQLEDGPIIMAVKNIDGDTITIDGNHPLADQVLTFDVEVVEIRDASEEELAHGHVHGVGGHHHH
ncbi:MAG: peptidylprolyl isomerase [Bacteroidetes bacterium]|nr:peptidylprolyl isomerase [Bacteroidota bacterium]MBU1115523.1 peptidylprolyl isomerase [Bacteroidota bacterium]MBU1799575.1 peptidylprolyl isomerase [Bacteroidota bacterium]